MFRKILVPVDSSEESRSILRWAVTLAKATNAEMTLLSVIDPEDMRYVEASAYAEEGTDVTAQISKKLNAELEAEAISLGKTGVEIAVRVVKGPPAEMIVAEAEAIGSDLIAMSTRRESALARGILGSVTDRVLHSTAIPLLILQPEEMSDESIGAGFVRHIVVPLDGSALSEVAITPAIEIARATGAELVFTEVVSIPTYGVDMGGVGYGSVEYAERLGTKLEEQQAANYLQGFVQNAESLGIKARAEVRVGNPSIQIVNEAAATEGSIIVMATHGAGGIKRWVIGSVADKAIRSAHRPVLVIPPTAA
jgi:nucleotide-binding universal stress UspA family protein